MCRGNYNIIGRIVHSGQIKIENVMLIFPSIIEKKNTINYVFANGLFLRRLNYEILLDFSV